MGRRTIDESPSKAFLERMENMMLRREIEAEKAEDRKEEDFEQNYPFTPLLSNQTRLINNRIKRDPIYVRYNAEIKSKNHKIARLKKEQIQREKEEIDETRYPRRRKNSRSRSVRHPTEKDFYTTTKEWAEKKQAKIRAQRAQKMHDEVVMEHKMAFKPKINQKSREILRGKSRRERKNYQDQRRSRRIEKLRKSMPQFDFKPQLNKRSMSISHLKKLGRSPSEREYSLKRFEKVLEKNGEPKLVFMRSRSRAKKKKLPPRSGVSKKGKKPKNRKYGTDKAYRKSDYYAEGSDLDFDDFWRVNNDSLVGAGQESFIGASGFDPGSVDNGTDEGRETRRKKRGKKRTFNIINFEGFMGDETKLRNNRRVYEDDDGEESAEGHHLESRGFGDEYRRGLLLDDDEKVGNDTMKTLPYNERSKGDKGRTKKAGRRRRRMEAPKRARKRSRPKNEGVVYQAEFEVVDYDDVKKTTTERYSLSEDDEDDYSPENVNRMRSRLRRPERPLRKKVTKTSKNLYQAPSKEDRPRVIALNPQRGEEHPAVVLREKTPGQLVKRPKRRSNSKRHIVVDSYDHNQLKNSFSAIIAVDRQVPSPKKKKGRRRGRAPRPKRTTKKSESIGRIMTLSAEKAEIDPEKTTTKKRKKRRRKKGRRGMSRRKVGGDYLDDEDFDYDVDNFYLEHDMYRRKKNLIRREL